MQTGVLERKISGPKAGRSISFCSCPYAREAPPGPSAALLHPLIIHALCSISNNSQELSFLHCFSVSPPSFTYCQQPSRYWRMFWSLKHSPQLLLWPLTHGIWLYSQLCWSLAGLSCLLCCATPEDHEAVRLSQTRADAGKGQDLTFSVVALTCMG